MRANVKKLTTVFAVIIALLILFSGCTKTKPNDDSIPPGANGGGNESVPYGIGHLHILPTLNLIGETEGLATKRECVLNYPFMLDSVGITDKWTIKNTTDSDMRITAAYLHAPFGWEKICVDGNEERTVNHLARYIGGAPEDFKYKEKLLSGAYLKSALEAPPVLDDGAVVYDLSGILDEDGCPVTGSDITISFKYDSGKTRVYVFQEYWDRYSEEPIESEENLISATMTFNGDESLLSGTIMLIVTGEDIFDYDISESGEEGEVVSDIRSERYETTVSEALYDLSKAVYTHNYHSYDIDSDDAQYEERSFSEWYKIVLEGFSEYSELGVLVPFASSEDEREPFYDLADLVIAEPEAALAFRSVELNIPAGGEVNVEISSGPSYSNAMLIARVNSDEYGCNCEEFKIVLDIAPGAIDYVLLDNNMGLDIEKGVMEAELDTDGEEYYFAFDKKPEAYTG